MQTRLALRRVLQRFLNLDPQQIDVSRDETPLVFVGLSGGADSLALAAALAAEVTASGSRELPVRGGAIVVDHGLQPGSDVVAERAADQAREMGLHPVFVRRAQINASHPGGPEAVARSARYEVFAAVASETGAAAILTAHTRDDQAEQVLLALARGSGTRSIAGIPLTRDLARGSSAIRLLRPFLDSSADVTRATTERACNELGLAYWRDPHNTDHSYARVRVREALLPSLEQALGGGVWAGLARSADLAREDAEALDTWAEAATVVVREELREDGECESVALGVSALTELPAAVRQRVIHRVARSKFGASLSREHTLAIAALVTDWRGQGPIFVPGIRVSRAGAELHFVRQLNSPRDTRK